MINDAECVLVSEQAVWLMQSTKCRQAVAVMHTIGAAARLSSAAVMVAEAVPAAAASAAIRQEASPPGVTGASAHAASSSAAAGVTSGGGSTYTITLASKESSRPRKPCLQGQAFLCQLLMLQLLHMAELRWVCDPRTSHVRDLRLSSIQPAAGSPCLSALLKAAARHVKQT